MDLNKIIQEKTERLRQIIQEINQLQQRVNQLTQESLKLDGAILQLRELEEPKREEGNA